MASEKLDDSQSSVRVWERVNLRYGLKSAQAWQVTANFLSSSEVTLSMRARPAFEVGPAGLVSLIEREQSLRFLTAICEQ